MTDERLELLPMAIAFGIVMVATFGLIRITQTMTNKQSGNAYAVGPWRIE